MNKKFSMKNLLDSRGFSAFMATMMAIVIGLIFGYIVMLIASPANAGLGFTSILTGGLSKMGDVFYYATPILMTGLAVGFAFKMGLFNIGASGQYTMGMFCAMYVGFHVQLPPGIHWIACVLAGMLGGMFWGIFPGFFKAVLNVNEVITSIMFNYIGMYLVDMLIVNDIIMYDGVRARTMYLPESAKIPSLGIPGSNVSIAIIAGILIAIALFVILNNTTFGYELKATGFNKEACNYAGMNGKRNIIVTMIIAGALAGLGGAFAILAPTTIAGSSVTYEPINVIAANGFNGIAVALLGNSNPLGIIFSSAFISYIQRGGTLSALYGFKPEIIDIVISVIIYFSSFSMIMSGTVKKLFAGFNKNQPKANVNAEEPVVVDKAKGKEE